MKKYVLVLIPLILFLTAPIVFGQETPSDDKKSTDNDTGKSAEKGESSETDEMFRTPLTKEEGKKIFESLPDEKKKEILEKWEELKKLPEEERQKALENFYKLLNAELRNYKKTTDDENSDTKTPNDDENKEFRNIRPEIMLANVLHMSFMHMQMDRNEKHMHLIYAIMKDDPEFFYKLRKLDDNEERFKLLLKKRDEIFDKEIDQIAEKIKLDDEKKKELKKLLIKQRDEEEKLEMKFMEKQMELWDLAHKTISENKNLAEKLQLLVRVLFSFKPHSPNDRGPGFKGPKHGMGQGKGFDRKFDPKNWNDAIDKMKLDEEKSKKLKDGFKAIIDKYSKVEDSQKCRKDFKDEVDKLLADVLTGDETKQFIKLLAPEGFGNRQKRENKNQQPK